MALRSSGHYIKFSEIETEFGQNTDRDLGEYRVSQTFDSGLSNQPLDTGIPSSGEIKFSDFYDKKLNVVIDYYSGSTENNAMQGRTKYNQAADAGVTGTSTGYWATIGGFKDRNSADSSGSKVRMYVGKIIGSSAGNSTSCAVKTGSFETGTTLNVEIGSSGALYGAGGDGGEGGTSSSSPNGENGESGSSGLGVEYDGTNVEVASGGKIVAGYGGGGGGGYRKVEKEEWWSGPVYSASGGGGGGGAGSPGGSGGGSGGTDSYWSGYQNPVHNGTWAADASGNQSSDADMVVRDYDTGSYNLVYDVYSVTGTGGHGVAFVRHFYDSTGYYEYTLNGSVVHNGGGTSWTTGFKKYEVGSFHQRITGGSENFDYYKIKYSERTVNNKWRFIFGGTERGFNYTGNTLTVSNVRYYTDDLVYDGINNISKPNRQYKIAIENYTSGNSGGGGGSGTLTSAGNGASGGSEEQAIGGEGGHGADSEQASENGEAGSHTGSIESENNVQGSGGSGGGSGAAIRRTSGITVNITDASNGISGSTTDTGF